MLQDLREDRTLHEGLSEETQVAVWKNAGGGFEGGLGCWGWSLELRSLSFSVLSTRLPGRVKKKENDKDEDVKEEERELKERRCFQCGDPGHVRRDCPEYRHLKQRAAAATGSHAHRALPPVHFFCGGG